MGRDDLNPSIERRRWSRVSEVLPVIHCDTKDQKCTDYFTRNIGGGGMLIEVPEAIPISTCLKIEFYVPMGDEGRARKYVRVEAQVCWVEQIAGSSGYKGSNRYRLGLSFKRVDSLDQRLLEVHVNRSLGIGPAKALR